MPGTAIALDCQDHTASRANAPATNPIQPQAFTVGWWHPVPMVSLKTTADTARSGAAAAPTRWTAGAKRMDPVLAVAFGLDGAVAVRSVASARYPSPAPERCGVPLMRRQARIAARCRLAAV